MTLRPPRPRDLLHRRTPVNELEVELLQEQASALGRLGRALEAALAALRAHDTAPGPATAASGSSTVPAGTASAIRSGLVRQASHALWMFIVQREACGMRDTRQILRDYAVPDEVMQQCGAAMPPAVVHRRLMR